MRNESFTLLHGLEMKIEAITQERDKLQLVLDHVVKYATGDSITGRVTVEQIQVAIDSYVDKQCENAVRKYADFLFTGDS